MHRAFSWLTGLTMRGEALEEKRGPRRALSGTERYALSYRFKHRCASCKSLLQPGWHGDHIQPLADGGADDDANMQPMCAPCHTAKTARENSARAARRNRVIRGDGGRSGLGVDGSRAIMLTEKCIRAFARWRARGESFRVDRYTRIAGLSLDQIRRDKLAVTKTRAAQLQAPYNASDLRHDLRSGFVVLR